MPIVSQLKTYTEEEDLMSTERAVPGESRSMYEHRWKKGRGCEKLLSFKGIQQPSCCLRIRKTLGWENTGASL